MVCIGALWLLSSFSSLGAGNGKELRRLCRLEYRGCNLLQVREASEAEVLGVTGVITYF